MFESQPNLTFRHAGPSDAEALERLAQRDSALVPEGTVLAAFDGDGGLLAAISLDTRALVADPFLPTAHAAKLLRVWARQLRGESRRHARRAHVVIPAAAATPSTAKATSNAVGCAGPG